MLQKCQNQEIKANKYCSYKKYKYFPLWRWLICWCNHCQWWNVRMKSHLDAVWSREKSISTFPPAHARLLPLEKRNKTFGDVRIFSEKTSNIIFCCHLEFGLKILQQSSDNRSVNRKASLTFLNIPPLLLQDSKIYFYWTSYKCVTLSSDIVEQMALTWAIEHWRNL